MDKKQRFIDLIKSKYEITGYIVAQELYPNADKTDLDHDKLGDSHLQGNLYFKHQVDFFPLLKFIQTHYPEVKTEAGLEGRTQLLAIQKGTDTQMDNYFKGQSKIGGDKDLLTNMDLKIAEKEMHMINRMLAEAVQKVFPNMQKSSMEKWIWED